MGELRHRARRPDRDPTSLVSGAFDRTDLRRAPVGSGARRATRVPRPAPLSLRRRSGTPGVCRRHGWHGGAARADGRLPASVPDRRRHHRRARRARLGPALLDHARRHAPRERGDLRRRTRRTLALRDRPGAAGARAAAVPSRRSDQGRAGCGGVPGGVASGRAAVRNARVIERVAVLGAGIMGRGIAYVAAVGGYDTRLQDASPAALDRAIDDIGATLDKGVAAGKLDATAAASARGRLAKASSLEAAVRDVDLVIEAVPEDMKLKLEVFGAIDKLAPSRAILASNTSSLSITEMAGATDRPAQVVGMHFFNPVHRMKLLEVVRALETAEST